MYICQQSQAPSIDWLGCLRATFDPLPLTEDDHVILHNLPYMVHMSRIIGKWLNRDELSNRYCKEIYTQTTINPFFSFLTLCCDILLHSAAHFKLTWSSICCTP